MPTTQSSIRSPLSVKPSFHETIFVILILLAFILIGFVQASKLPALLNDSSCWIDEVMFVDPVANLYFGKGFNSAAWFAQNQNDFWAGYPPLYPFLLYLWMKLFGFSLFVARSLNYFLAGASAFILWLSMCRLNLRTSAKSRVALMTLLVLGLGYTFDFRTGRPDILMATLSITALLVCSIQYSYLRYALLACLSILFPLAGLALATYTVILCTLLLVYLKKSFLKESISIAFGLFVGTLCLYIFYSMHGVWNDFLRSIKTNPSLLHSRLSLSEWTFGGFSEHYYFQLLFLLLLGLIFYKTIQAKFQWRSLLSFGLIASFGIPFGMKFIATYPVYYGWMASLPLSICVCSELSIFSKPNFKIFLSLPVIGILLTLCFIGQPLKLAHLVVNWNSLDYSPIEALIDKNVTRNEWIFSDSFTYYAAKKRAAVVISKFYLPVMSLPEKEKVSVLAINSQDFEEVSSKLGGKWYESGDSLEIRTKYLYKMNEAFIKLKIYRKAGQTHLNFMLPKRGILEKSS